MAASTQLVTDANSMLSNGVTANTAALAIAAAGPIQDMVGNQNLYKAKLLELKYLLGQMKNATDAGDPNLTLINNALLTLS